VAVIDTNTIKEVILRSLCKQTETESRKRKKKIFTALCRWRLTYPWKCRFCLYRFEKHAAVVYKKWKILFFTFWPIFVIFPWGSLKFYWDWKKLRPTFKNFLGLCNQLWIFNSLTGKSFYAMTQIENPQVFILKI
jgi:hypothetical protein